MTLRKPEECPEDWQTDRPEATVLCILDVADERKKEAENALKQLRRHFGGPPALSGKDEPAEE